MKKIVELRLRYQPELQVHMYHSMYMHVVQYECVFACRMVRMYVCMTHCIYAYVHSLYIHIFTHTHTHTHTQVEVENLERIRVAHVAKVQEKISQITTSRLESEDIESPVEAPSDVEEEGEQWLKFWINLLIILTLCNS